ncbi:MAG: HD domain-containing protein [Exilispira sp.]|jgi:metal-dependent HD superfamily phosphatase/phosphodiesterase|nr:HD domain-containing protein [Exilispira sp.]
MNQLEIKLNNIYNILFEKVKDKEFYKDLFYKKVRELSNFWNKYQMLQNIKNHSKIVAIISLYLLLNLKTNNRYYDVFTKYTKNKSVGDLAEFVLSSSLLHDIGKSVEIKKKSQISHSEIGYTILLKENFKIEAVSCRLHLINSMIEKPLPLIPFIINIADKHVMHEKVVSIKERFYDLRQRYTRYDKYFTDDIISMYEKFLTFFHTENLQKVIFLYNTL